MPIVNEKSTAYLTATFRDKNGVAAQPTSSSYQIDTEDGTSIRTSEALSPSSGVVEITLNKDDNTLKDTSLDIERHRVTVNGVFGSNDEVNNEFIYEVRNLAEV